MVEWVDITKMGSAYEEQYDSTTGQYRHREKIFKPPAVGLMFDETFHPETPWQVGRAPDS